MSKICRLLVTIFVLTSGLLISLPQTVLAANCSFTYNPDPPNQDMDNLTVTITSADLASGNYRLQWTRPNKTTFMITNVAYSIEQGASVVMPKAVVGWEQGEYILKFLRQNENLQNPACSTKFTISETPTQKDCKASIPTTSIKPSTDVTLHVEGIKESNKGWPDTGTGGYDIVVNKKLNQVYETKNGEDINLGTFDVGTYLVNIMKRCGFLGTACSPVTRQVCAPVAFKVASKDSGGGGEIPIDQVSGETCKKKGDESIAPGDAICTESKVEGCGDNAIKTAIGCVHTNPVEFTKDLLKFVVAIGGGLAFLMMLLGAFQMVTSAGNPETLAAGKDRLTSAVIGLLFVLFAVLLLQILGVDILGLPEFKRF